MSLHRLQTIVNHVAASTNTKRSNESAGSYKIPTSFDPSRPVDQQDKLLFTPGPLTTSYYVKKAMMVDLGSRDVRFTTVVKSVCDGILRVAGVSDSEFTVVPVQGSGTFGVEAAISTAIKRDEREHGGRLLILVNGAYGERMVQIAKAHKIKHYVIECPDNEYVSLQSIDAFLRENASLVSHVCVVHSETTSGIVNDIHAIGSLVKAYGKSFIVDSMSAFGAYPINFQEAHIDFLVSSSNKCIEGVPGFSFVIARKSTLANCKGNADTLSLDLFAQSDVLNSTSQFRFTPPVQSLLAFQQALSELSSEGGVVARGDRYRANQKEVHEGMARLGFQLYLHPQKQGHIISSYVFPTDKNWSFSRFYERLSTYGFVIYPGKVSKTDCFRIGHIGRIFPDDSRALVAAIRRVCEEMQTAKFYPRHTEETSRK